MRWWLFALLALCLPVVAAEDSINVTLIEYGRITDYLNTYWVVNVNGTGIVENPSDRDLYDVRLYFDIVGLDIIGHGGAGEFDGESVVFGQIPARGAAEFSYQIVGISVEPPTLSGKGVLYTGMAKRTPRIYSDLFGELQKAPLEDSSFTGRPGRLVSVTLNNPTTFQFTIESLRVLKTPGLNPNVILEQWNLVNSSDPRILDPDGLFVRDILDRASAEGMVYWIETDVYISKVQLIDRSNITRYTERNLTIPVEELNFTNATDNFSLSTITSGYALRKQVDSSVAVPGEPMVVSLVLHNFGDSLAGYALQDTLPAGFIADRDLHWTGEVPARGTSVLSYRTTLVDNQSAGIDTFPRANATVGSVVVYSQEVPFVRQFVPDERIYVQKRVSYREDDSALIRLSVENLGRSPMAGATLKDLLTEDELFSEISVQPLSKGTWEIPRLLPGDTWEVSYVTERGASLTTLPVVYGVPAHSVLRSIVLENVVSEAWEFVRTNGIELLGILTLIAVPVLFIVGRQRGWLR